MRAKGWISHRERNSRSRPTPSGFQLTEFHLCDYRRRWISCASMPETRELSATGRKAAFSTLSPQSCRRCSYRRSSGSTRAGARSTARRKAHMSKPNSSIRSIHSSASWSVSRKTPLLTLNAPVANGSWGNGNVPFHFDGLRKRSTDKIHAVWWYNWSVILWCAKFNSYTSERRWLWVNILLCRLTPNTAPAERALPLTAATACCQSVFRCSQPTSWNIFSYLVFLVISF